MPTSLLDVQLEKILAKDKEFLEQTEFPIVTVSSTFREELKEFHGNLDKDLHANDLNRDIVLSRAHFSMAFGTAVQAWLHKNPSPSRTNKLPKHTNLPSFAHPESAWLVDPINYVSSSKFPKIAFTETIGKIIARNPLLKTVKGLIDKYGRSKLPISDAITPPLLHLFQSVEQPIISFHIESGNKLAAIGKKIVQVVTDPHVREDYLLHADLSNIKFCVFDEKTRADFFEKAALHGKTVDPERVIVTGPPVDPRIISARRHKNPEQLYHRPLRVLVTTGGLGTNKQEIELILHELFDFLRQRPSPLQILCYGGTHHDFTELVQKIAREERVAIEPLDHIYAKFRLIHGKHIMDVNELLLHFGFPWADCVITKPSGDMAYDAAAAGCSLLFLSPWGEWEENIQEVFEQLGVGRKAEVSHIKDQFSILTKRVFDRESWFEEAQKNALTIPKLFLNGSANILRVAKEWK